IQIGKCYLLGKNERTILKTIYSTQTPQMAFVEIQIILSISVRLLGNWKVHTIKTTPASIPSQF
ncbi:hypothetical protein, partial [Levilactobacillus spicheri]|uniref:hypothetical protein n=1 Tax=Levilactobacillus spicheri TaxID=216463 RepID=UPI001CDB9D26